MQVTMQVLVFAYNEITSNKQDEIDFFNLLQLNTKNSIKLYFLL